MITKLIQNCKGFTVLWERPRQLGENCGRWAKKLLTTAVHSTCINKTHSNTVLLAIKQCLFGKCFCLFGYFLIASGYKVCCSFPLPLIKPSLFGQTGRLERSMKSPKRALCLSGSPMKQNGFNSTRHSSEVCPVNLFAPRRGKPDTLDTKWLSITRKQGCGCWQQRFGNFSGLQVIAVTGWNGFHLENNQCGYC